MLGFLVIALFAVFSGFSLLVHSPWLGSMFAPWAWLEIPLLFGAISLALWKLSGSVKIAFIVAFVVVLLFGIISMGWFVL